MANLKISQLPSAASPTVNDLLAAVNGGTTSKITIQDIINLTPNVGFTGNTSGDCITDIYVSNVHSCSPLYVHADGQLMGTFTELNGFALENGVNMVIPTESQIEDINGVSLLTQSSTTNIQNAGGVSSTSVNFWGTNDLANYTQRISGTTSGATATTRVDNIINIENNYKTENFYKVVDGVASIKSQKSVGYDRNNATGMFYSIGSGLDSLNKNGTTCFCAGRPQAWGMHCVVCKDSLESDQKASVTLDSYINEAKDASFYILDATSTDDYVTSKTYLHSDFTSQVTNQTIFESGLIAQNTRTFDLDYNLDYIKEVNPTSLITTETISGDSSGTTATTVFSTSYNLIDGRIIDTLENPTHPIEKVVKMLEMESNGVSQTISGTSTGITATTVFRTTHNIEDGIESKEIWDHTGTQLYQATQNFSTGIESKTTTVNSSGTNPYVTGSVIVESVNVDEATTTYRLVVNPIDGSDVLNTYSIYGTVDNPMVLPPSYQEAPPFGANTGGVNPSFIAVQASAAMDGWLTVGITDGDTGGALSSIGIVFDEWDAVDGLTVTDGSVFWQDPNSGPTGSVVVAQVTIPTGSSFDAYMNVQGRTISSGTWQAENVLFAINSDTVQEDTTNSYERVTDYSGNLIITESLGGSNTGTTGTTVFQNSYDMINGTVTSNIGGVDSLVLDNAGLESPKVTTNAFQLTDGNQADGYVLTSDSGGTATWQAQSGGLSYKIFTAVVSDFSSPAEPVMTILENTLGVTPTISYVGTGEFRINSVEAFPLGYTTAVFGNLQGNSFVNKQGAPSNDYINWVTTANGGSATNGQMYNMTVEIKVFTP